MRRLGIVLILLFLPLSAYGWTAAADARIATKGAALAPPDLRMLIERFDGDYRRGIERARQEESNGTHRERELRQRLERETTSIATSIRKGDPMATIVERLGGLSHLVADANNPFQVRDDDGRLNASQDDYERYFERRMPKFPTVFYGLAPNFRLTAYLDKTFARSAKFYPLVGEEYFRGGSRHSSAEFDDRSTAFAIAAVSYSRAVTDLVNLYYFIWKEAGGDVRAAAVMRDGNLKMVGSGQ
ncbi:MAG: hypothetical protein QOH21_3041 [Acidobacteriota bacterium]|jgi:hypothetical protein|nr:hypothetical protein [Acidobacteriota bacterium]